MATSTALLPVTEYIQRFVEGGEKPAFEYVAGVLLPKGMGTRDHGRVQRRLLRLLEVYPQFEAIPEVHSRILENEFRIPDIVVERRPVDESYYPAKPVYLCIEIVSPDQTDQGARRQVRALSRLGDALLLDDQSGDEETLGISSRKCVSLTE